MRLAIDVELDYTIAESCDVLLQIEAAATPDQRLERQDLAVWSPEPVCAAVGEEGVGQRCWARGDGAFRARYSGVVDITRTAADLAALPGAPPRTQPGEIVAHLMPSRYCESDRFGTFVRGEFAGLEGGALALALADWVHDKLTYRAGTTSGVTTAGMTFVERRGVCRDYAHLFVALARAGDIPARCVSCYAPGVSPPDFHAVAQVWLGGGWHLIDPTRMATPEEIAIVAVGRDATDIAFMTIFGEAALNRQNVAVNRLD